MYRGPKHSQVSNLRISSNKRNRFHLHSSWSSSINAPSITWWAWFPTLVVKTNAGVWAPLGKSGLRYFGSYDGCSYIICFPMLVVYVSNVPLVGASDLENQRTQENISKWKRRAAESAKRTDSSPSSVNDHYIAETRFPNVCSFWNGLS